MKNLKYFIVSLFLICTISIKANAASEYELYQKYCSAPPYDIAGGFSQTMQKITGMNLLAAGVAESTIKKSLKEFMTGDIKVKVKSYSATDASKGKFKSFEITGKNLTIYNSVFMSEFYAKTTCKFIHLDITKEPAQLLEPMAIDFSTKFSEKDMNRMINTSKYKNYFFSLRHNNEELRLLEIRNPHISLKNNKFHYSLLIKPPFMVPFIFTITSDLKIENNKINIKNLKIGSASHLLDASAIKHFINVFDPLWFAQLILEQNNCNILLKSVKIEDGNIILTGSVFLGKTR